MSFVIHGGSEFRAALKAMGEATNAATRAATATAAHLVEAETKKSLSAYSHPKGTPTSSPAGRPPAVVSGQLRRSVKVEGPRSLGAGTWEARIGPTAVYGRIQELGGNTGWGGLTRLPARPYLAPTVDGLIKSGRIRDVYVEAWRGVLSTRGVF